MWRLLSRIKIADVSEDELPELNGSKCKSSEEKKRLTSSNLLAWLALLDPEDGGNSVVRNVSKFLPDCLAMHPELCLSCKDLLAPPCKWMYPLVIYITRL
jgi:hypothetical protein